MKRTYPLILTLSLVLTLFLSNGSFSQNYVHYTTLTGHTFPVNSIAFSPDGHILASGSHDGTIRLWDATTGEHMKTLTGHADSVLSLAFNSDGLILASGNYDGMIRLWDPTTGEHMETVRGHESAVRSIVFSPDALILASGSADNTIRFWDTDTGRQKNFAEYTDDVHSIVFSPNGHILASGNEDGTVRLWSVVTGAQRTLYKPEYSGEGVLSKLQQIQRKELRHWEKNSEEHDRIYGQYSPARWIHSIAFSPDGHLIASGGRWQISISLWNAITGEHLRTLIGHTDDIHSVAFSPDGRILASGSEDGTVRLWKLSTTTVQ